MESIIVTVGNTAEPFSEGRWRWKVFVEAPPKLISTVQAELHPTFRERHQQLHCKKSTVFETDEMIGWGMFSVRLKIRFADVDQPLVVEHRLQFQACEVRREVDVGPFLASNRKSPNEASTRRTRVDMDRKNVLTRLRNQPFLASPANPLFFHGRICKGYSGKLSPPDMTWKSALKPRDDHDGTPDWLTASEYQDDAKTSDAKLAILAQLLRMSNKTVVYSGAGISTAAGIGMAARGGGRTKNLSTTAQPTLTHYTLATLYDAGLIHGWVQQNHDGLPQKAGFPQECINEIHGSWYDPSNPVVLYSGSLKRHECQWMEEEARSADLVLVLGTSLGGLNADQVATRCADRSLRSSSLGMVVINLQQTAHDDKATLRLFGKSDDVLEDLLSHLNEVNLPTVLQPTIYRGERRVLVPYDANGRRSTTSFMWWDLRPGTKIQLTGNHNIHGSEQPRYRYLKAPYQGTVLRYNSLTSGIDLNVGGVSFTLGQWWLDAAIRGGASTLPIVNVSPELVYQNCEYALNPIGDPCLPNDTFRHGRRLDPI